MEWNPFITSTSLKAGVTTLVLVVGACGVVGVVILAIGLKCFVEIVDDKINIPLSTTVTYTALDLERYQ